MAVECSGEAKLCCLIFYQEKRKAGMMQAPVSNAEGQPSARPHSASQECAE